MSNPFLEGNYAPVTNEQTVTDLEVTGELPDFLDGRYLRNGPNPLVELDPQAYHWFTGDGMVHGVRIADGRAHWYRNRWVRSPRVAELLGEGPRPVPERAGAPGLGANTNVLEHAGRTLALVESGIACYELTDELDTVGGCDFGGTISGGYTAHPKRDPRTGELHAVSYSFTGGNQVEYSVIDTAGRVRRRVPVEVTGSPMMHDFALTDRYVVLYDLPVTFDARSATSVSVPRALRTPARMVMSALVGRVRVPDPLTALLKRRMGSNAGFPYSWDPSYPARVGVMPREGGNEDVRWFDVEPCFVFHTLNAYDDGDSVVLDVARHRSMFDTPEQRLGPDAGHSSLERWTIDLAVGKVREECLDERAQEFPRIDERLLGARHRYGYSVRIGDDGPATGSELLCHDLREASVATRSFGPGTEVGEFVFVPRDPDAAEDDGVLMGLVYDHATQRSELAVLDAASLETVGSVRLPLRVPNGFHGNWCPTMG